MVAHQGDANAIGNFAVKKVIGETSQISPTEFGTDSDRVESPGIGGREFDEMPQLLFEFVTLQR